MSKMTPYSNLIENSNLGYNYRILADHSRMITIALADGVLPLDW